MVVIKRILFIICIFLLVLSIANSLSITPIYPKNNSIIYESSTWLNISTNEYENCSYSLNLNSFVNFNKSTAGYWKVRTSTKKLDLSEELTFGINREILDNITTFIQKVDLKALDSGNVTNSKNSSRSDQFLYLLGSSSQANMDSGFVVYTEDDDDVTADYLFYKAGREIGRYLLEFETPFFQSGIYNENNSPSQLGLNLKDFENISIELLGKNYKIIKAKRISPNGKGIRLILSNKTAEALVKNTFLVKDTLLEKQTKSYTLNGKNYDVTLNFVDSDEAQFIINSQATGKLKINWKQDLMDDLIIEVNDILYQDFAGGIHSATFSIYVEEIIISQKLEIRDDNVEDYKSTNALKVDNNTIDNALITIEGTDDNSVFKISRIHVNMTADDNFFVAAGETLSYAIQQAGGSVAEPQVLFTQNWDIVYKGLKNENTEKIKLKTSGTSQYNLQFVDGSGNTVEVPIAKSPGGSNLLFGEIDRDFVNVEAWNISKDDYLVITNGTAVRGSRPTYILQYKGADGISIDGHVLRFKNLGSGITINVNYTNSTPLAYLNLSGIKNGIYLATSADINQNDFNIQVDLDGDGILGNDTTSNVIITTRYGAEINLTNQSVSASILFSIRTPDDEKDTGKNITNIETVEAIINVTNGSGNTTINTKEVIKIYLQNKTYYLEFTDRSLNKVNLPIAENGTNNTIFFGQINKSLINKETSIIKKDYYFIASSVLDVRDKRSTHALQYLGADSIKVDSPALRFKNLGNGQTFQQTYSDGTPLTTVKLGGQDFRVYKSPSADTSVDDFDIQVDLDANGSLSSDNGYIVPITTYPKGVEINITNETLPNTIQLTIRTFDTIINQTIKAKDNVDTLYSSVLSFKINASSGMVNHVKTGNLNFRVPSGQTNVEYAYTSYGTYIKRDFPSGQPATLDIDYPEKQREPLVYYENAGEHSKLLTNLNEGQHTIKINCTDIFDRLTNFYLTFNYTTIPNVTSYFPPNGSINVSIKSNIIINFSKNIDISTLKKSTIIVKELNSKEISGKFIYNETLNQTTFDPTHFLKDNTTYVVNVTKNIKDLTGTNLDKNYVWSFTTSKKDIDNDGISDDEDNDNDNDGIDDNFDYFRGNLSNINSNFFNLSLMIDSDENVSKNFNGTKKIEFRIGHKKLLEFDFNFTNNSMLDLSNLSILNASNTSLGGVVIRGVPLTRLGFKKIAFVEKIDSNKNGICIKDEEIDWIDNISNNCDGENEYKVECDGTSQSGYICIYNSTTNAYQVSGLSHSGVVQLSYTKPSNSGSSGGDSSGGGGGGGGGGAFFVCNMDWKCGEWSTCSGGLQIRECNFVKVPQHAQDTECPSLDKAPITTQKCEVVQKEEKREIIGNIKQTFNREQLNENKNGITGMAVQDTKEKPNIPTILIAISVIAALSLFFYYRFFRLKN